MVSRMAVEDCEALEKKGAKLSPEEIVRLNALGCRCERHPDAASFFALPRCAFLGDITFREPTIGQELWFDKASQLFDTEDDETYFMLRAFSLVKEHDELPKWSDSKEVLSQLKKFMLDSLSKWTIRQVMACVNYCLYGSDANEGECPAVADEDKDENIKVPDACSAVIGVVHESQSLKLGIPLADACKMTKSELQAVIQRAYEVQGIEVSKQIRNRAIGEYYITLEQIKKAHQDG